MGKNKKSKQSGQNQAKKQKKEEEKKHSHDASCGDDHDHDHNHEQEEEVNEGPQLTPQEKAQQYKDMQLQIYNNFLKDFQDDEKTLLIEPAHHFAEKLRDNEKREKEEFKKVEKILKKDAGEIEELYQNVSAQSSNVNQLKAFRDRIAKTITEITKQQKSNAKQQQICSNQDQLVNKMKSEIQSSMNKKNMLANLCNGLLDKNYDLYMKHEQMLEDEKKQRQGLASQFQEQMSEVTKELEQQKQARGQELKENQEIRSKIQKAITDYKVKEEDYRSKMESHGKIIQEIEKKLKHTIDGSINKTVKEAEQEKTKFQKSCNNVAELSNKINDFMQKFDKIKDEMSENGKKFEHYQMSVETKKLEMQAVETEIQNILLSEQKIHKFMKEGEEEKKRLSAQIDALRNLKDALLVQLNNLEDQQSEKENSANITNSTATE
ncbi:UNKNOWN [Stylonychia lemnae]|uniref:Uncharacterized protein n=1 Tax=Stylonychia lemnae TaxID=5949 RepID=A0A077ZYL0_STYLE|nr:UNKNOWN [Stylonychia lemnae]|eukprot:CDW74702.1 UNKNOWN [Stylonychia lemnae]